MSHLIELPDDVYNALEEAAASCGTTPAKWLESQLKQLASAPAPALARCPEPVPTIDSDYNDVFWRETATPRPR